MTPPQPTPRADLATAIERLIEGQVHLGSKHISVHQVMRNLEQRGVKVWLSGGCLRDLLAGVDPNDIDLTVSCHVSQLRDLLVMEYGADSVLIYNPDFGTLRYGSDAQSYLDFSMLRDPDDVVGHAHFKAVRYRLGSSLKADARNRDFPFNALYWRSGLVDPTGRGVADALNREITICQDPRKSAIDPRLSFRILLFAHLGYSLGPDARAYLNRHIDADTAAMGPGLASWLQELTRGRGSVKAGILDQAERGGAATETLRRLESAREHGPAFRSYLHPD